MAALTPKTLYVGNTSAANVYTVSSNTGAYTIVKNFTILDKQSSSKSS